MPFIKRLVLLLWINNLAYLNTAMPDGYLGDSGCGGKLEQREVSFTAGRKRSCERLPPACFDYFTTLALVEIGSIL